MDQILGEKKTFCVTGATSYIGSSLVRLLLQKGYNVHAMSRDPDKASKILSFGGVGGEVKLFKADMLEQGSYDKAMDGCDGVFHVAAQMELGLKNGQNPDSYLKASVHGLATSGMLNVLESSLKAKSVKRVVITSSMSIISAAKDRQAAVNGNSVGSGGGVVVVDESCLNSIDQVIKSTAYGWVYETSKLIADQTAFRFSMEKGLDLVSIIPASVGGSWLTPMVPTSIQVLLSPVTGDSALYPVLSATDSRLGCIPIVHIDDICSAHIFLMEEREAKGRYICAAHSCSLPQLSALCYAQYPFSLKHKIDEETEGWNPTIVSSQRLKDLGFEFKHGIDRILKESIDCCVRSGFLNNSPN